MHEGRAPTKSLGGPSALALVAVVVGNVALAFGPWFVRVADTGPVAAAFWRMALGLPFPAALGAVSLKAALAWLPALALGGVSLLVARHAGRSAAAPALAA